MRLGCTATTSSDDKVDEIVELWWSVNRRWRTHVTLRRRRTARPLTLSNDILQPPNTLPPLEPNILLSILPLFELSLTVLLAPGLYLELLVSNLS
jgi:hypothetical protein